MRSLMFYGSLGFLKTSGSLRFLIICLIMAGMSVIGTSCDPVHQFPEMQDEPDVPVDPTPDDPTPPEEDKTTTIGLRLQYHTDFTYRDYVYDSKSGSVKRVSDEDGDTYDNLENLKPGTPMKVTVKVHLDNSARTLVSTQTFLTELEENYDCDVEMEVPSGNDYLITVWGHLLDESGNAFYNDTDFNSIELMRESYVGNTDMRDAYRGRLKISTGEEKEIHDVIDMFRPMCKLEFVTTGLQEFLANEEQRLSFSTRGVSPGDYTVVISYPAYYPSHYMAMDDRLEYASTGYSYSTPLTMNSEDDEEASIGFDYVLINNTSDAAVQAQVTVYHSDGTQVASTGMLTIPMQRDRHVVLRGNLFTTNNSGGVGIDPDFEGDINIPLF